jgi:hypothetical protein
MRQFAVLKTDSLVKGSLEEIASMPQLGSKLRGLVVVWVSAFVQRQSC